MIFETVLLPIRKRLLETSKRSLHCVILLRENTLVNLVE